MVRIPLNRTLRSVWQRCRRHPKAAGGMIAATVLSMAAVIVLSGSSGRPLQADGRTSLLELLDQVSRDRGQSKPVEPMGSSPQPPLARSWSSPLTRQCSGVDPAVRRRLESLLRRESSWRSSPSRSCAARWPPRPPRRSPRPVWAAATDGISGLFSGNQQNYPFYHPIINIPM